MRWGKTKLHGNLILGECLLVEVLGMPLKIMGRSVSFNTLAFFGLKGSTLREKKVVKPYISCLRGEFCRGLSAVFLKL